MKKNFFDILFVCHKIPSRSFFYKGKQFPICARCTGIFIGYLLAIIYFILQLILDFQYPSIYISTILVIPTLIDGVIQYFTHYESGNYRRLITGILAGFGIIFILRFVAIIGISHGGWLVEHFIK